MAFWNVLTVGVLSDAAAATTSLAASCFKASSAIAAWMSRGGRPASSRARACAYASDCNAGRSLSFSHAASRWGLTALPNSLIMALDHTAKSPAARPAWATPLIARATAISGSTPVLVLPRPSFNLSSAHASAESRNDIFFSTGVYFRGLVRSAPPTPPAGYVASPLACLVSKSSSGSYPLWRLGSNCVHPISDKRVCAHSIMPSTCAVAFARQCGSFKVSALTIRRSIGGGANRSGAIPLIASAYA